jgi:hypothetical protein
MKRQRNAGETVSNAISPRIPLRSIRATGLVSGIGLRPMLFQTQLLPGVQRNTLHPFGGVNTR